MPGYRRPPFIVDFCGHRGARLNRAPGHAPDMEHNPLRRLARIGDLKVAHRARNKPMVAQLATLFGIERSLGQQDGTFHPLP